METIYSNLLFAKLLLEGVKRQTVVIHNHERFEVGQQIEVSCYGFSKPLLPKVEIVAIHPFLVDLNSPYKADWWKIILDGQWLNYDGIIKFAQLEGFDVTKGFDIPQFVQYFNKVHPLPVSGQVIQWNVNTRNKKWYGLERLTQPEKGCYQCPVVKTWYRATPITEIAFPQYIVEGIPANWIKI